MDQAKPLQIVKDIKNIKDLTDQSDIQELKSIEREIEHVLGLYDKKKTIIIPKIETIENNKNDKNLKTKINNVNQYNNVYNTYTLTEYSRPLGYVIYSEERRKKNHLIEYEASIHDYNFLKCENFFISLEKLEEIITALENKIEHKDQVDAITKDSAKKIILEVMHDNPDKEKHYEKIINVNLA